MNPVTEEEVANKDIFPDNQKYYKLPSNVFEAKQMNDNLMQGIINHERAMNMVGNSLKAQRPCNEAIIFTYGLTGAGKTSTLNHIFGIDEIIIKKHRQADTTLVSEYIATMKSDEWKVTNLEIGFIDVPGWNDTRKGDQDAFNMANIDYFIKSHPYLGCKHFKMYPSIILVAIDTTNKRSGGSDNGSLYAMIHNLSKLRIVDRKRPNVLFVLTNVHSIAKGEYKDTIKGIEKCLNTLSNEILGIKPEIVHIENKWEAHELDKKGEDWTVLRDGTPQPINVLKTMMAMTKRCKDEVGQEAIRIFVMSRGTNHPKCRRKSNPTALSIGYVRKWKNELASQFIELSSNEVNNALFDYANTQIDTYGDPDILNRLILEMEKRKISELKQLQSKTLNQLKALLTPYEIDEIDEIESKALIKVCGVIPFNIPQIIETIGHGVNTEQGIITKSNLIQALLVDESHVMANLKVPKCMEAVIPIETTRVLLKENNNEAQAGCVKYQFQISQSVRCIRLLSNQQQLIPHLSPAFKEAVAALPDSSVVEESQQMREEYQHFFNTYGHFVIVACECGGVVQGEVQLMENHTNDQQLDLIKSFLYNLIDRLEMNEEDLQLGCEGQDHGLGDIQASILNSQLSWIGGKQMIRKLKFKNLTHRDWIQWVDSLIEDPIPLDTEQLSNGKATPVFQFVDLLDQSKSIQVRLAHETLDISPFKIFPENTRGLDWENAVDNLLPEDAFKDTIQEYEIIDTIERFSELNTSQTLKRLKNGRGFLGTSTVVKVEANERCKTEIQNLIKGDEILYKKSWCNYGTIKVENISAKKGSFQYRRIEHQFGEIILSTGKNILKGNDNNSSLVVPVGSIIAGDTVFCLIDNKVERSRVKAIGSYQSTSRYSIKVRGTPYLVIDQLFVENADAACFPRNASVTLKGGEKVRMDEVKIGDYVLSIHPSTGKPVYSKVYLWAHRDPHVTATFLHITHPHGHLHISASHLILSREQRRPVPAGHLSVGDTIHSLLSPAATATAISVPVLHIHTCTQVGYYAPFTNNGLIVVDGIASSVYSQPSTRSHAHVCASVTGGLVEQFGMHRVGQCVMTPVRVGCKLCVGSLILTKQMDTTTHIHKYCQWLMKIYERFI